MVPFRRGLNEAGFVEGRNIVIEYRWAEGHLDRMPRMAADLVGRHVAVILVGGGNDGVRAALSATKSIPIVFTTAADPVEAGLVTSLNRPGGNATGVTVFAAALTSKKLELLHEIIPSAKKIAILANENNPVTSETDFHLAQTASTRLGLEVVVINGGKEEELGAAFASAVQQNVDAILIISDAVLVSRGDQIAALSLQHKLPTISSVRNNVRSGQLLSYGADDPDMYRQAGAYVGRILKGEKAGDLPVLQPTKFLLTVNLKTAKALSLKVPSWLLATADEVIE
jgi:putative ABC transport system substrate-binding protein